MRRIGSVLMAVAVTVSFAGFAAAAPRKVSAPKKEATEVKAEKAQEVESKSGSGFKTFAVYIDQGSKDNHFAPSGWMGDYGDLKVNPGWSEDVHSGKTCVKITYSGKMTQNAGWTGMYWQHPANNWGDKQGGFNLTGASKLTFWAKGEKGGEKISEFKFGGITGEYPDSDSQMIGPIELTNKWQKYTIELKDKDLSHIIGGFCWAASRDDNPEGFTIYVDDVMYE